MARKDPLVMMERLEHQDLLVKQGLLDQPGLKDLLVQTELQ